MREFPVDPPELPTGYRLDWHCQVDSTNAEAIRLAEGGAPAGMVVWAGEQLAGRGRQGRSWASPPGNLYCSILLRPDCAVADAAQISFAASLAVIDTIGVFLPLDVQRKLKWPNDVLVDGRKISGILLEARGRSVSPERLDWLVVGIGINIANYPPGVGQGTTCLRAAGADHKATPGQVLNVLVRLFHLWVRRWSQEGFAPLRVHWQTRAHRPGEAVKVRLGLDVLTGQYAGVDEKGALIVIADGGSERRFAAGEVFFS